MFSRIFAAFTTSINLGGIFNYSVSFPEHRLYTEIFIFNLYISEEMGFISLWELFFALISIVERLGSLWFRESD